MQELEKYVGIKKSQFPELSEEIDDLHQLCLDEIEEGGSEVHEIELCTSSIEDLITEHNN